MNRTAPKTNFCKQNAKILKMTTLSSEMLVFKGRRSGQMQQNSIQEGWKSVIHGMRGCIAAAVANRDQKLRKKDLGRQQPGAMRGGGGGGKGGG